MAIQGDHEQQLQRLERSMYVSPEDAKWMFKTLGRAPDLTEGNPMPAPLVTRLPPP